MLQEPQSYDLAELAGRADVSPRTIRYYIQQGLLPSPETRGPGSHYSAEHLERLRLIRRLQREHLPLAEIRRRLGALAPGDIRRLLKRDPERSELDAKDYIRKVLAAGQRRVEAEPRMMLAEAPPPLLRSAAPRYAEPSPPKSPTRSQWDRIALTPDVELHVRRPLSREQNRQVERLLEAARTIFEESP